VFLNVQLRRLTTSASAAEEASSTVGNGEAVSERRTSEKNVGDFIGEIAAFLISQMVPYQVTQMETRADVERSVEAQLSRMTMSVVLAFTEAVGAYLPSTNNPEKSTTVGPENLRMTVWPLTKARLQKGFQWHADFFLAQRWPVPDMEVNKLTDEQVAGINAYRRRGQGAAVPAPIDPIAGHAYSSAIFECIDAEQEYLKIIQMEVIALPGSPFRYAPGPASTKEVIRVYSIDMRSCSRPLAGPPREMQVYDEEEEKYETVFEPTLLAASMPVELSFRIPPNVVQRIRYGYKDINPFKCVRWDYVAADWKRDMCQTLWSKSELDMVHCSCSEFGGVYGIEVLGAPPSEFGGIPAVSQSWKNCLTYFLGLATLLIYGCIRLAMSGTRQFATAEDELCDILLTMQALQQKRALAAITPIQKKKKVKSRAQQLKEFGKKKSALQLRVEAVLSKYGDKWRRFLMTTSGHPLYQTPEVKELQIMRRSARDEVYEKFYTDSEGRVLPNRQALPWQDNDDMEEKLERWALPVYQRPEVEKN
jgi:hypothetical protein